MASVMRIARAGRLARGVEVALDGAARALARSLEGLEGLQGGRVEVTYGWLSDVDGAEKIGGLR